MKCKMVLNSIIGNCCFICGFFVESSEEYRCDHVMVIFTLTATNSITDKTSMDKAHPDPAASMLSVHR